MKSTRLILLAVVVTILSGSWALPINDVKAINDVAIEESVELTLTAQDVKVKQNDVIDPLSLVVTGTYDALDYSIVDTSEVGQVTITYIAAKGHETIKMTKTIEVVDSEAPVIEGEEEVELRFESEFVLETLYTAIDEVDGEVDVEVVGELDRSTAGVYELQVRAIDSSNNVSTKDIVVTVNEDPEVIARNERNEEYKGLVSEAATLNNTLLADTSVAAIEKMINRVYNAKDQDSDYASDLASLYSDLSAKLDRAEAYYAPKVTTPTVTAPSVSTGSSSYNGYAAGWCTWWVASQRYVPNGWGDAINWINGAYASGMAVGSAPAVGAIMAWPGVNHVAYVTAVHGNGTVTITEMGWNYQAYGFNSRVVSTAGALFIY